ncbi:MAG: YbaK/EbsC family protein [Alphaproteobacteria bacterium]|nr:YbaK/EbsC family protein [Alphaproteobacteria bacterium]
MSVLERPAVRRVQAALAAADSKAEVMVLSASARSARDAADSLGVALGAIVKSLVFTIAGHPVMALIAGDRQCDAAALGRALGISGSVARADADTVNAVTGFSIGGVAPLGLATPVSVAIDESLGRFATVYAAAGHPNCVFATTLSELARITGGRVCGNISIAAP